MKNSEPILAKYLEQNRFNYRYEEKVGAAYPDFSVWQDDKPYAFWDVVDRRLKKKDIEEELERVRRFERNQTSEVRGGPDESYHFVRAKIRDKHKQFTNAAPTPGMLVLAEWAGRTHFTPEMMAAALFGWPTVEAHRSMSKWSFARAKDGKMVNKGAVENNSISAIGVIQYRCVNYFTHGLAQFTEEVIKAYGTDMEHCLGLIRREERRQRESGIDLDLAIPVLDIYLNAHAYSEWPSILVGLHDRVYEYCPVNQQYFMKEDGLKPTEPIEVPASGAQHDIWTIMSDPRLRND